MLPRGGTPPNVIFILIDTLRADRLGAYGHKGRLTPTLDSIAAEGVLLENCEAQAPWTLASVGSLFSACYPSVHKATDYFSAEAERRGERPKVSKFNDEFDTLAEALRALGYQTAGVSANPFVIKEFGYAQGFDYFNNAFGDNGVTGLQVNQRAIEWLDQRQSRQPLFLYLHYMDAHGPYDAPGEFADELLAEFERKPNKRLLTETEYKAINEYLKETIPGSNPEKFRPMRKYWEYWVAAYEAGVREADYHVGRMIAELKKRGLWDNAYVIITADHGEAFCEHGYWEHGPGLYESELHVPMLLRWPGVLPRGERIGDVVELFDIMPTILEQFRRPLGDTVQGQSFLELLQGKKRNRPGTAFAEAVKDERRRQWAFRRDNYKLIRTHVLPDPNDEDGPKDVQKGYELYDCVSDRDEQRNLNDARFRTAELAKLAHELTLLLDQQIVANERQKPGLVVEHVVLSESQEQGLKGHGYIQKGSGESQDESRQPTTSNSTTRPAQSQPVTSQPTTRPAAGAGPSAQP